MAKNKINQYLSLEASESESEEESEDLDVNIEREPVLNYTDIAKRIKDKYLALNEDIDVEEEEVEEDFVEGSTQAQFLPKKSSPRLFLVRVKRGSEKEIALRILQNKSKICSIIAKDGLKGYIYIEAYQKQQVLDSFEKIRGIFRNKLSIVPQNEMIEAISYKDDLSNVEFGRLKKGKYKGDLVQIIGSNGDMVKVRVMPRINEIKKLFDPVEYKDEVIKEGDNIYIYKRDLYVNGYLEKEILRSSVDLDIEPNFNELEQFNIRKRFDAGDKVKVIKGELIGTKGVVKSVTGPMTIIVAEGKNFEIFSNFLDKYYNIGEEVCFNSENGIITNIKNNKYFIAIKNFTEEVVADVNQIKKPIPYSKEFVRKEKARPVIKRDNLINKQVQIRKGQYKGYIGIVKDIYMNKCRIQISSNLKYVSVPREDLVEFIINNEIENVTKRTFSSIVTKTPAYEPDGPINLNIDKNRDRFEMVDDKYKNALVKYNDEIYTVEYLSGNNFVTDGGVFNKNAVKYITPSREDNVIIMQGEDLGKPAILLEIDELTKNCVVKILNGNIKNLPLGILTKKN
ncbi:hypothetical protein NCER_101325 [Vairimorpha ceranae BRL01]|uniref:Chromatin elongation factor SPT5 n=1 Tax=Vairimorpha ceranae (strain BRL01) TaxID=578460 RepID=C4V9R4_VAIC1|nr:hypothetical protein NCER_101325 [Vairimorpha ceranae BRL01]